MIFSIGKVEHILYSTFFAQIIFFYFAINYEPYLPRILNIPLLSSNFLYIMIMLLFTLILKIKSNIIIFNNDISMREENIKKRMKELATTLGKILGKKMKFLNV